MTSKTVSAVAFLSAAVVGGYVSGCGTTQSGTGCEAICAGCCDSDGKCQGGTVASACGVSGASCQMCSASQLCQAGACVTTMGPMDSGMHQVDAGVDAGVLDAGMQQMTGDGGTCAAGMFCGRILYNGTKTGVAINFVLHNTDPVTGPPSKIAKMDAGTFPMNFEFPAIGTLSGNPLAPGNYYFITWLDVMAGDSASGPNYAVDPVSPPKTMPPTPAPKQVLPASGGAAPIDITLVDP
ncbi:MAG: hypothetical protein K1X64_20940 [Myxococcaceae bacterium]|nr:hypothetical protein [Myxococcaceae bacterium]